MNHSLIIRSGAKSDVLAVAEANVSGWLHAYRGIISDAHLDTLNAKSRAERFLSGGFPTYPEGKGFTLVGENLSQVIGCVQGGPAREATGTDGEIYSLYIRSELIGQGFGKQLFLAGIKELKIRKFKSFAVWVFEKNKLGRDFYERQGGYLSSLRQDDEFGGKKVSEVCYTWDLSE